MRIGPLLFTVILVDAITSDRTKPQWPETPAFAPEPGEMNIERPTFVKATESSGEVGY